MSLTVAQGQDGIIEVAPRWSIVPATSAPELEGGRIRLVIEPSSHFGDGSHETTRLCLQALATYAPRHGGAWRLLDFGSGTGILAIAAARLGALAVGIEIDAAAVQAAARNAHHNELGDAVQFGANLEQASGSYDIVVANILRQVLLEHAAELCPRLAPGGCLILSGLVATDVPEVSLRYTELLGGQPPEVFRNQDWQALVWRNASPGKS